MIFIPTYFSQISQYAKIVKSECIIFEVFDNYQKQTYRNRCYICGANGKQLLNIPVKHNASSSRKKTKDMLVANEFPWQSQHYKSLYTAYNSSPFYEFFEDDLVKIFSKNYKYLLDVNIDTFMFVSDALQIEQNYSKTTEYKTDVPLDNRSLSIAKNQEIKNKFQVKIYKQMFDHKYGFLSNLSILDLLFMEGPNAISFLE